VLNIDKKILALTVGLLLIVTTISGCTGNGDTEEETVNGGEIDLSGRTTYSGDWEGSLGAYGYSEEYSGTWQFEVDFDEGNVEGWFRGDGSGDITGTVSDGIIEASGEAAFGVVQWSGDFSSGGEKVSGTWEITEEATGFGAGSGTWSGSVGEMEEDIEEEEEGLPEEDETDGEEPLERYPGSVMLSHRSMTAQEASITEIEYGTMNSVDEVVGWYEESLGQTTTKESDVEQTSLGYLFGEDEWVEITVSANDWTTIEVEYAEAYV